MNLRRRHQKEGAEVFTDSLNDIMFFMMLFFLIISTLVNNAVNVNLPSSKNVTAVPPERPIMLAVTNDHQYYLNEKPVALNDLESAIQSAVGQMQKPELELQFDSQLTVQDIVDILQIGAKLKVKMVMATRPSGS